MLHVMGSGQVTEVRGQSRAEREPPQELSEVTVQLTLSELFIYHTVRVSQPKSNRCPAPLMLTTSVEHCAMLCRSGPARTDFYNRFGQIIFFIYCTYIVTLSAPSWDRTPAPQTSR